MAGRPRGRRDSVPRKRSSETREEWKARVGIKPPTVEHPVLDREGEERETVLLARACAFEPADIARLLGIPLAELQERYGFELEHARALVKAALLANLRRMSEAGSVAATKTLLAVVEHGQALTNLSPEEILRLGPRGRGPGRRTLAEAPPPIGPWRDLLPT